MSGCQCPSPLHGNYHLVAATEVTLVNPPLFEATIFHISIHIVIKYVQYVNTVKKHKIWALRWEIHNCKMLLFSFEHT